MPFRRRIPRQTRNKGHLQHSGTAIQTLGPATAPQALTIVETDVGARTLDGSQQIVSAERNTGDNNNVGDLVKFINVFIETGPRPIAEDNTQNGFLEWSVVVNNESDVVIPITNLGTATLMEVANKMFPTQVLLSGFVPVGKNQPAGASIQIKVPKKYQYCRTGRHIQIWTYFRTVNVTATGTSDNRAIVSYIYKSYY